MSDQPETAVVVGATGAMGRVIAQRLAEQGLRVLAVARDAGALDSLVAELPGCRACEADIASDEAVEQIGAALEGPVRAVVHGPGVATAGGVMNAPTSAVVDAVNIKVGGFMRLVRAVDAHLVSSSRLIAIGGHYGFEPTAYAATAGVANAALVNLVRQYSWAYGSRAITAHLLAPGPADTDRLRRVAESRAERDGRTVDAVLEELRNESAIGAFTTPAQVAWAVTTLLAPEANALAGSSLMLDSGRRKGLP